MSENMIKPEKPVFYPSTVLYMGLERYCKDLEESNRALVEAFEHVLDECELGLGLNPFTRGRAVDAIHAAKELLK